jgi:hypothetical protein
MRIGKRIGRAITNTLLARDRMELRAMDALLSLIEAPPKKPRHAKARKRRRQ